MGMRDDVKAVPGTAFNRQDPPWWKRFGLESWHDWSFFLFWRVNWSDFTLIKIEAEAEWRMSNAYLSMALLGFHLRLTYYWPSKERDALVRTVEEIKADWPDEPEVLH
jgi:hypothetical protein